MGRTVSRWEASAGTWAGWQCILTGRLGVEGRAESSLAWMEAVGKKPSKPEATSEPSKHGAPHGGREAGAVSGALGSGGCWVPC